MSNEHYKILLIDDDEDERFLIEDFLFDTSFQFELTWAKKPTEAFEQLSSRPFDILFVDFYLGAKNGLELIEDLKKSVSSLPPYILLTGQKKQDLDLEALRSGAADYLAKEDLNSKLLDKIIRYTILRDIQSKELLREQTKFRSIFKNSTNPIVLMRKTGEIAIFNDAFFSWYPNASSGMNLFHILNHDDKIVSASLFDSKNSGPFEIQTELGTKKVTISIVDQTEFGDDIQFQVFLQDISDQMRLISEQKDREKAQFAEKMARLIAHEVRNPLTNIQLSVEQLESGVDNELNQDDLSYFLDIIKRNGVRINDLVDLILDSSSPSELRLDEEAPEKIAEEAAKTIADRTAIEDINFLVTTGPCAPFKVDEKKFLLALSNLLKNAVEAVANQDLPTIELKVECSESSVVFQVCDNGIGMDEKTKLKIWKPFFSGKSSGKGLGLTLTKNIIEAHGATINCESTLGKGTTFTLVFPL
ncbi:hybrid sensor histidine kinase/response regulator [Sanyastnella coralliicola]|uniref:hybrid sensor histidine kinase/response regulator n=1 Tax=Sanyastnella coralliicola TaxID=3069118 RepID=UPI0027B91AAB|nr:hybrid sensor histidine kinase/response regulator [Longitalea sp. SCSIO 12813]